MFAPQRNIVLFAVAFRSGRLRPAPLTLPRGELVGADAHFYGEPAAKFHRTTVKIANKNLPLGSVSIDPRAF
jgi:hypothetical protein